MVGNYAQSSLVVGFAIIGITKGHYELGFLFISDRYFQQVWGASQNFAQFIPVLALHKLSFARFMLILQEPINIANEQGKKSVPANWQKIEFRNVGFRYGDQDVLRNISFTIERGQKIGVVGPSGSGKSTLFKLFLKEYENYSGDILIQDTLLRDISARKYFDQAAVVPQETEVFNFSLKDNVTLPRTRAKKIKEQFRKAVRIAHLGEVINRLPKGEKTLIGEKGVKLSGGEKQRLSIARAVYKQPEILFMDEATSSLDVESERKIKTVLEDFFGEVTAVVIAHRLTTIKEMDKIIVLEEGRIVEQGTFEDLMTGQGRFYELWQQQQF